MNNSEIIAALVNAEKAPADRIEKNEEQTENKISAYSLLKSEIKKTFLDRL